MGIWDGFGDFLNNFIKDGAIIAGDCFGIYDQDHARKMKELIGQDARYLYLIQQKCGIDPFSEEYYGEHSGDISIVNIDHFAVVEAAKNKLEEYRQIVYAAIDEVYNMPPEEKEEALEELDDDYEDDYDFDTEDWD